MIRYYEIKIKLINFFFNQCEENHGIFVRQSHLTLIDETGARFDMSASTESLVPKSSVKSRISR